MTRNISSRRDDETAAARLTGALSTATIDALLADAKATGTPVDGANGLLNQMTKAVLDRTLQVEMSDHLAMSTARRRDAGPATPGTG